MYFSSTDYLNRCKPFCNKFSVVFAQWPKVVLPQASHQKSLDSQKKFTRSEKITSFQIFASKFAALLAVV